MSSFVKRTAWSALLALLLLGVAGGPAQAQLGVSAGANFDSVEDIKAEAGNGGTLENATGYHLGVVYDFGVGPLNFRPGVFYRKIGTFEFPELRSDGSTIESDVSAIEVPVDVRLTFVALPVVSAYLLGGPNAVFPRSDGEFENELEDVSYTFNIGVGAGISVPGVDLTLQPELRYEFGATDYVSETFQLGDDGPTFEPTDRKISAFALRLNVLF